MNAQKIVLTEKGVEKKKELKVEVDIPEKIKVQFDEQFLIENVRRKRGDSKQDDKSNSQKSIFSVKPYFLECKQALEQTVLPIEVQQQNEKNATNKLQYPGMFPPQNKFTTFSKRFPYDQPMRATTSQQELRKRIIKLDDVKTIQQFFTTPQNSSSQPKFRARSLFPATTKNESNNAENKPITNEPVQNQNQNQQQLEDQKEIKAILQSMGNNQQNAKHTILSSSQLHVKPEITPLTDRKSFDGNSNIANAQPQQTQNNAAAAVSNQKSQNNNINISKNNSVISLDLLSKQQQLEGFQKNTENKVPKRPSTINLTQGTNKDNYHNQNTPTQPISNQKESKSYLFNNNHYPNHRNHHSTDFQNKEEEFLNHTVDKAPSSEPKSESKKFIPNGFSPIKGALGFGKYHSMSNISQLQASMMLNESMLQNKLQKMKMQKLNYQKNDKKLKSMIQEKVNHILEEKGNKPVHVATNFIQELKGADDEIDELYEGTTKQKKRYQERLKLFHIKKYKNFFSDLRMHTAQLTDKHHQIAHLGQKILEDEKFQNQQESQESKPAPTIIFKNK